MASEPAAIPRGRVLLSIWTIEPLLRAPWPPVCRSRAEDQAAIDVAWATEIARRVDEVLADRVELIDADEHYARLRSELAARPT